ncbi:MAG: helix-turn-helix domain-containing protein [Halioglobus sp.]
MQNEQLTSSGMPLVRLSLVNPFIFELARREIECTTLLEEVGLPSQLPLPADLFIAVGSMYQFTELAAEAAGDPYLGANIGSSVAPDTMASFGTSADKPSTVGQVLVGMVASSEHHATSVKMSLHVDGGRTSYGFERVLDSKIKPAQIDGYYVGMLVALFRSAMLDAWNPKRVLVKIRNPQAIPPDFGRLTLLQCDNNILSISFPTEWLMLPLNNPAYAQQQRDSADFRDPPGEFVDAIREALLPHIDKPDLSVERAATICGYEKRQLSGKLKRKNTTLAKEIASLREQRAVKQLVESTRKISDIARSVGYSDPTIFSRAFKNWTGHSPQVYRKNHRSKIY